MGLILLKSFQIINLGVWLQQWQLDYVVADSLTYGIYFDCVKNLKSQFMQILFNWVNISTSEYLYFL